MTENKEKIKEELEILNKLIENKKLDYRKIKDSINLLTDLIDKNIPLNSKGLEFYQIDSDMGSLEFSIENFDREKICKSYGINEDDFDSEIGNIIEEEMGMSNFGSYSQIEITQNNIKELKKLLRSVQ